MSFADLEKGFNFTRGSSIVPPIHTSNQSNFKII